jgi:hypothetical protein
MWLSLTSDKFELILNAASLAFVLELDEHIFSTMAPQSIKQCMANMAPLEVKPERMIRGLNLRGPIALVGCVVFLAGNFWYTVDPMITRMHQVKSVMCDDKTGFVADINEGLGYAVLVPTFGTGSAVDGVLISAVHDVVSSKWTIDQLTHPAPLAPTKQGVRALVVGNEATFYTELDKMSIIDFFKPACVDVLHVHPAYLEALRFRTGLRNASTCADFKKFCRISNIDARWVRSYCSQECGCDSAGLTDDSGCPKLCLRTKQKAASDDEKVR